MHLSIASKCAYSLTESLLFSLFANFDTFFHESWKGESVFAKCNCVTAALNEFNFGKVTSSKSFLFFLFNSCSPPFCRLINCKRSYFFNFVKSNSKLRGFSNRWQELKVTLTPRGQFHQHFTLTFWQYLFATKNYKAAFCVWNFLAPKYWQKMCA